MNIFQQCKCVPSYLYNFFYPHYNVCCRTKPTEFIIQVDKYVESIKNNFTIGMRFNMRFEAEEAQEQRYNFLLVMSTFDHLIDFTSK